MDCSLFSSFRIWGLCDSRAYKDNKERPFSWKVYSGEDWKGGSTLTDVGWACEIRYLCNQPVQSLVVLETSQMSFMWHKSLLSSLPCRGPLAGLFFFFVFLTGSFSCSWLFNAGVLLGSVFSHLTMHYLPLSACLTLWKKCLFEHCQLTEQNEPAGGIDIKDAIFLLSLYSVVIYQFYFTGQVLSGSVVEGKKSLCMRISTGEGRKVKHTGFLQWKEIFTCPPPGMLGNDVVYNLVIVCYLLSHPLLTSPRIYVLFIPDPFHLNLEYCF